MNGFNMLPDGRYVTNVADIDSMLWEASNKLARSQIARQISNNSVLHRQHMSRIQKPASTGNSPSNNSRQRIMASRQRLAPHHSDIYPQVSRRRAITAATNDPAAEMRPLTWHPQVMPDADAQIQRHAMYDASYQHMPPSQPATVSNGSSPAFHLDPHAGHRNRYYSVPAQQYFNSGYMHVPISSDWSTDPTPAPPSAVSSAATLPTMEHSSIYGQTGYASQPFVPLTPSTYMPPQPLFQAASTSTLAQANQNVGTTSQQQTSEVAVEDDGPELIAMGLYDKPEGQSRLFGGFSEAIPRASGRGLKLEDSWTPPEDDESDDGSGDEAEDDEEQQDDETDGEPDEPSLPQVYGSNNLLPQFDMSNKTFLLDGKSDAAMGAAALRNLTMADWNVSPQSWTS